MRIKFDTDVLIKCKSLRNIERVKVRTQLIDSMQMELSRNTLEKAEIERNKYQGNDDDNTKLIGMWEVLRISQDRLDENRMKKEELLMDQLSISSRNSTKE